MVIKILCNYVQIFEVATRWQPLPRLPRQLQLVRLKHIIIACKCQTYPFMYIMISI